MGKIRSEDKEDLVFLGPGVTNHEMNQEFKKLYDSLMVYKENVFHLVDTICTDCEAKDRLALNIVQRDTTLVQQLVAKECSKRSMMRSVTKNSVQEELPNEKESEPTVQKVLQTRSFVLSESANAESGE
jgi:hypothetical protein